MKKQSWWKQLLIKMGLYNDERGNRMINAYYKETLVTIVSVNEDGQKELKEVSFIGILTNKEIKDQLKENEVFVSKEVRDNELQFDLTKFKTLREKGEI